MSLAPGSYVGVYEIVAPLGVGGMGEVYRARDPKLRRQIAIKVLPPAVAADPERVARFEREAQAVAALSHPNILAIHDFGSDGGVTYAVMELLDGRSLRDLLSAGPLPRWKATDCATQIAKGLEAAHARGIVHRDLKPENVFVSAASHVKILDFGLAALRGDTADATQGETVDGATQVGAVMGTPGYMSPEQVRGDGVDHRSDIFSFGCVVYEMLSGKRAFLGASPLDTMQATLHSEPRDLSTFPNVPESLVRIVARCLEKAPGARFQSAGDLVFALNAARDATSNAGRSSTMRVTAAAISVVALAGVVLVWSLTRDRAPAPPSRPQPQPPTLTATAPASAPRGIAVLPFENLGSADQRYFAAGLTEEVTLQIAKISALRVMSRPAVARFKDPAANLPSLTRELGVGAVLAGSVRQADNRVRIGVQLLATPSGETMWSEQYDGDLKDVLEVQSTVALQVARALQASLTPEERARIERPPTENADAYELYLKSQPLVVTVPKQNQEGIDLLQRAIALDPDFALAYALLARRYAFVGYITGRDAHLRGLELARKAVSLDPQLARAHYALALALAALGQAEGARLAMQRAIELDINFWNAIAGFSVIETNLGHLDQAMYWAKRAVPLAPNLGDSYYHVAIPLLRLDDVVAERWLRAARPRFAVSDPDSGGERLELLLAIIEFRRGQTAAAIERLRASAAAQPESAEGQTVLTEVLALSESAGAAERLDAALKRGPGARMWMTPYTPRAIRAFLYAKAGESARAQPLIEAAAAANREALASGDRSYPPHYENAALFALRGDRSAALESLELAERAGWKDAALLRRDPLLAPLANEPRFRDVIARIERDLQDMRKRVGLRELDALVSAPVASSR